MARPAMWKVRVESEAKVELKTTGDLEAMAGAETGCRGDREFRGCLYGYQK